MVAIFPLPHPCAFRFPRSNRQISKSPISSAFRGRYFSLAAPMSSAFTRGSASWLPLPILIFNGKLPEAMWETAQRDRLHATTGRHAAREPCRFPLEIKTGRHVAVRSPRAVLLPVIKANNSRETTRKWKKNTSNGSGWNPWDGNSSWDIDATVPTHGLCEHTPNQP